MFIFGPCDHELCRSDCLETSWLSHVSSPVPADKAILLTAWASNVFRRHSRQSSVLVMHTIEAKRINAKSCQDQKHIFFFSQRVWFAADLRTVASATEHTAMPFARDHSRSMALWLRIRWSSTWSVEGNSQARLANSVHPRRTSKKPFSGLAVASFHESLAISCPWDSLQYSPLPPLSHSRSRTSKDAPKAGTIIGEEAFLLTA